MALQRLSYEFDLHWLAASRRGGSWEIMTMEFADVLDAVIESAPTLHGSGTFSEFGLRALARIAGELHPLNLSVETGSGASTILFSHLSKAHITFTIDSGSGSLDNVRRSALFRSENVSVIKGPSQLTLPKYGFSEPIDLALIDGPHAYPFPDLEYFYFYPHIRPGGILIVDDIQIRSIRNLFDFLTVDEMWNLKEVVETTAYFTRTEAPVFPPTGDGWWLQKYNNSHPG